jgi:hypothetical protein
MGLHQAAARGTGIGGADDQFGMEQIHRADIERRRNPHATRRSGQPFDKIEAHRAVIETAIDMGLGYLEKRRRPDRVAEAQQNVHRKGGALPLAAIRHVLLECGEMHD